MADRTVDCQLNMDFTRLSRKELQMDYQYVLEWAVLVVVASIPLTVLMFISSERGWQFCKVVMGNIVTIVTGETFTDFFLNITGHKLSNQKDLQGRCWIISRDDGGCDEKVQLENEREEFKKNLLWGTRQIQWILWKKWGVRFVSWVYPHKRIHKFPISMNRAVEVSEIKDDTPLSGMIKTETDPTKTTVSSLRAVVPRLSYLRGIELGGDGSTINLLVLAILKVVIPNIPLEVHKGKNWLPNIDSALKEGFNDFFSWHLVSPASKPGMRKPVPKPGVKPKKPVKQNVSLWDWNQMSKGNNSPLHQHMASLNFSQAYRDELETAGKNELVKYLDSFPKTSSKGRSSARATGCLLESYGCILVELEIIAWEPCDTTTTALMQSYLKKETAKGEAGGVIEKARGDARRIALLGTAEGSRFANAANKLFANGVPKSQIASILAPWSQAGALPQTIQTFAPGAHIGVMTK